MAADAGAIKAGGAYIEITAEDAKLQASMEELGTRAQRWGQSIGANLAGAIGISLSAAGLFAFGRQAIGVAAERERAEIDLASALAQTGAVTQDALDYWGDYATQLSRSTSITRDAVLETLALGASFGELSGKQLADATKAAIGWAKVMGGTPLETMRMMMMVMRGGIGAQRAMLMFERWGVNFGTAQTPEQRMAALTPGGATGFQRAEAAASGMAGDLDRLKGQFEAFSSVVGETAFAMSGLHDAAQQQLDDAGRAEATFLGVLAGIGIQLAATLGRILAAVGDEIIGGFAGVLGFIESWIPGMGRQARAQERIAAQFDTAATEHFGAIVTGWKSIGAPKVPVAARIGPGKLPKDLGEMGGAVGGEAGIVSAIALAGAMPGGVSFPGGGAVGGPAPERAADALETFLPRIAENTRKEPASPYEVRQ